MAPKIPDVVPIGTVERKHEVKAIITEETHKQKEPPAEIVWTNVVWFLALHLAALYGMVLVPWAHPLTLLCSKYSITLPVWALVTICISTPSPHSWVYTYS
jgi:hypothetical protein